MPLLLDIRYGNEQMFDVLCHDADGHHKPRRSFAPQRLMGMLGVSRSWLYQAAKDGRTPSVRLGGPDGPLRFHARDVEQWLNRARGGLAPGRQLDRHAASGRDRRLAEPRSLPLIDA